MDRRTAKHPGSMIPVIGLIHPKLTESSVIETILEGAENILEIGTALLEVDTIHGIAKLLEEVEMIHEIVMLLGGVDMIHEIAMLLEEVDTIHGIAMLLEKVDTIQGIAMLLEEAETIHEIALNPTSPGTILAEDLEMTDEILETEINRPKVETDLWMTTDQARGERDPLDTLETTLGIEIRRTNIVVVPEMMAERDRQILETIQVQRRPNTKETGALVDPIHLKAMMIAMMINLNLGTVMKKSARLISKDPGEIRFTTADRDREELLLQGVHVQIRTIIGMIVTVDREQSIMWGILMKTSIAHIEDETCQQCLEDKINTAQLHHIPFFNLVQSIAQLVKNQCLSPRWTS